MGDAVEPTVSAPKSCAQCGTAIPAGSGIDTGDRTFCATCYDQLQAELREAALQTSSNIPYGKALTGAVLGGIAGTLLWWGFTVVTEIALGLIAIAIGWLVGQGAVRFSGGKKSREMQIMCVGVALVSILVATYLVNMSFINRALEQQGDPFRLGFPTNFNLVFRVIAEGFGVMDFVFIAITLWEAWKIPAPIDVPPPKIA